MNKGAIVFWSWNGELEKKELKRQIKWMKNCGIGGFFMHARGGLKKEYLSKQWFEIVRFCIAEAEKEGLEAWAYDENGWPSGFCGGELFKNKSFRAMYLTKKSGSYDKNAFVSYVKRGEIYERADESSFGEKGECLNLYLYKHDGLCDVANPFATEAFLSSTHEKYKLYAGAVKGFFTDEPQYCRFQTPYTPYVEKYFTDVYGENVLDGLYLLFTEKGDYREFRYKYYKALQKLMLKNYAEKIYLWCNENGYEFTGHYVEENSLAEQMRYCMGIMPFYEYQHICGVDWLGRDIGNSIVFRQLDSVAAQTGKKYRICETYGCTGWGATPAELKRIAEFQFLHGINVMCHHLIPYSETGERKRDYPEHFSPANPWCEKSFGEFNRYFNDLHQILSDSEEIVDVAVFHPIRSAYFYFKGSNEIGNKEMENLDADFKALTEKLDALHVAFHYVDETILSRYGSVKNGVLTVGNCAYKTLIFPSIYTMDRSSEQLIRAFTESGGKVLLCGKRPMYLEGKPYDYEYLKSTVSLQEIADSSIYRIPEDKNLAASYRLAKNGEKFIYLLNLGDDAEFHVHADGPDGFMQYSIETRKKYAIGETISLKKYQSALLYSSASPSDRKPKLSPLYLTGEFEIVQTDGNYFTIDTAQYSFDGVNYGEKKNVRKIFDELLHARYEGDLYLKYSFRSDFVPQNITVVSEDKEIYVCEESGRLRRFKQKKDLSFGKGFFENYLKSWVKIGENHIIVKKRFFQSADIYHALFEVDAPSLRHKITYDTEIESIYLRGDFSVKGLFYKGDTEGVIRGKDFYLTTPAKKIQSLIYDGFPFFAGNIVLKKKIVLEDTARDLRIGKRFDLVEVTVNGSCAGKTMFSDGVDVSAFLVKGENEIMLSFTLGNRNLLGPFHACEEDVMRVSPGSWKELAREDYSFVVSSV